MAQASKQHLVLRFLHPGVLDKGNYSMFAAPRPILPGEPEDSKPVPKEKQVMSIYAGGGLECQKRSETESLYAL